MTYFDTKSSTLAINLPIRFYPLFGAEIILYLNYYASFTKIHTSHKWMIHLCFVIRLSRGLPISFLFESHVHFLMAVSPQFAIQNAKDDITLWALKWFQAHCLNIEAYKIWFEHACSEHKFCVFEYSISVLETIIARLWF